MAKYLFWLLAFVTSVMWTNADASRASGTGASLDAMPDGSTVLELQMNGKFWQVLSWQEAMTLSEFVRDKNNAYKRVPLQYLFPIFRRVENIHSRSSSGEQLAVEVTDLEQSYLRLSPAGSVDLILDGELQQNPIQLNVYGDTWPQRTVYVWLEEDFEQPFLLSELEIYQRFHNIRIEVVVVENLLQELSRSTYRDNGSGERPDMILADRETMSLLRNHLQVFSAEKERESLAYLELFSDQQQFYAAPFALEPYSIIYNSDLLNLDKVRTLSDLFGALEEAKTAKRSATQTADRDPYFVALDSIAFTLLFQSFLKESDFHTTGFNVPDVYAALQYLREQGQRGLLKPLRYAEDLFAKGEVSALMTRSGASSRILAKAKPGKRGNKEYVKTIQLPYNDLRGNTVLTHPRIWSLSVLRNSVAEQQAVGLRSFLLRGAVQSQFDLSQGILPSNTEYYPFYQRSTHYALLPKGELRYSTSPEELWEYGIEQRRDYWNTEELNDLLKERIPVLLQSDIDLELLLNDLSQQWQKAESLRKHAIFD